ncbi:MAG TPA: glycoside hydrolase [Terriglobales bacterium]|nr:glycoside hydrolase [Terriglobales bacterium]
MGAQRLAMLVVGLGLVVSATSFSSAQAYPETTYQQLHWRMIGPFRGGRTRAAAGVPTQPNVFYIGAVNGGVWKSDDYGRTWNPIFDAQPTQSIGAIAVAPSDPNIVYVASGEGLHRPDLSVGNGIYRSADGGNTWKHLGLEAGQQIPALVVDPRDPNRLFAAVLGNPYGPSAERGIFRSLDGGVSWQKVLYKDDNTGGSDIALDPSHPEVLYAALWEAREGPWEDNNLLQGTGGGLFKSTDGGDTWKQLTNGLPTNLVQVNVALAPSRPSRIYASVGTSEKGDYESGAGLAVYRSDDGGESWARITEDPRPAMRIGGGDLSVLRVDPANPDVVYSASIVTVRSADGGKSWTSLRGAPGGDDYQNLWINPNHPNLILLVSDQGGIVTVNGGETWSSWYNQPSAQLYHVAVSASFPYKVCSGQQESGSVCISSRGNDGSITNRDWHPVGVIEYGYAAPDPLDPDLIYGGGRSEVSKYHWSTGQIQNVTPIPVRSGKYRADRTQPVRFSPIDPHILYYATNVLFKTTDGGDSWQAISPDLTRPNPGAPPSVTSLLSKNPDAAKQRGVIYSLAPSLQDVNTLWAGTDDGLLWITRDGGKNWTDITPPQLTPWSKVTQIEASHFDDHTAYASVSRFRIGDLRPYVYRTHDGGKSWQPIVRGLPDGPADTVREDPVRKGLLFAGTENAVWVSFNDGDDWQSLELNLPHTSMRDLWIKDDDLIVATHGRSFWILDDITCLRQITGSTLNSAAVLFEPGVAYRVRRSTYPDTPIPPDEPLAENPPDGAVIDYFLSQAASEPLTIEILDSQGKLVRRYSSADQPQPTPAELEKQLVPPYWVQMPKTLSTAPGAHRWVWDLHYPAPTAAHHEYPISAVPRRTPRLPLGPLALPGNYSVRLTVNRRTYVSPLVVKLDPRVNPPPSGLRQMFDLERQLAALLTSSSEAVLEAHSIRDQLNKLSGQATGTTRDSIEAFRKKLLALTEPATAESSAPTLTQVNSAVSTLYGGVGAADATPTAAQVEASKKMEQDTTRVIKQWKELKTSELPGLNLALHRAGLPELHLDSSPSAEAEQGDEE